VLDFVVAPGAIAVGLIRRRRANLSQ
jgi:hypothetical protein